MTQETATPIVTPGIDCICHGHLQQVDGVLFLYLQDAIRLRISEELVEWPTDERRWHVIPSTDSTGAISSLSVVSHEPLPTTGSSEDRCDLVGRVVQLGKKGQFVRFKVQQAGKKTIKPTLLTPDPRMKDGQLWRVSARRIGNKLEIEYAAPATEAGTSEQAKLQTQSKASPSASLVEAVDSKAKLRATDSKEPVAPRVLPSPTAPTDTALQALVRETGEEGWSLATPNWRRFGWEWEAFHRATGQKARVQVNHRSTQSQVYLYSQLPQVEAMADELSTQRLIVTPLGAARGIGASCFKVEIGPYEVVLDCGTRPKGYDPLPALEYLERPDLLLITHAHQDHLGAVPVFHARYPGVRMICTPGTREIAQVMLSDCLKVQAKNEDSPPLFDETDLERTLFRLETQQAGGDFEPLPGLKVRFINAGHIVGAACIYIRYGDRSLLYTGDYNTTSTRTTTGLRLDELPEADILITESTYGADTHPARKTQETALIKAIASVVQAGGNVLIPAFALGRAQEILLALRTYNEFQNCGVPVYVDGLVRAITDVFRDNLEFLPTSVQNLAKSSLTEPFFDEKGIPPIIPITHPSQRPLAMAKKSVIVASSGMLTGGASVYYAQTLLERENAAIFISGYTDEESPGRLLQSLQTGDEIELDGKTITVRARIERFNLSAHADKIGLTQVINRVNPKHLILIHGSQNALHELARSGDLQKKHIVHIPAVGEAIGYGQLPEHWEQLSKKRQAELTQPAEFEVEVVAEMEGAWIRIPESVVENDPRWQMLAASGILKAKWDGIHLKLTPFTQRDLAVEEAIRSGFDCCGVCQFFEKGHCQCEDSPMHQLLIDPSGHCPEFIRESSLQKS